MSGVCLSKGGDERAQIRSRQPDRELGSQDPLQLWALPRDNEQTSPTTLGCSHQGRGKGFAGLGLRHAVKINPGINLDPTLAHAFVRAAWNRA